MNLVFCTNNPLFVYNFTYTLNLVFCHIQPFIYLQFYLYFERGFLSQTNLCLFTILPLLWNRYSGTNNPLFIFNFTYTLKLVFCHKQSLVYLQFYLYFKPGIMTQTILGLFTILPILWTRYYITSNPLFIYNFTYTLDLVFCHKQSFVYLQFYLNFEPGILSLTTLCLFTILPILWTWFSVTNNPLIIYTFTYTLKLVSYHKQSFVYLQFYLNFETGFLSQTILCLFTILPILWNWYSVTNNPLFIYNFTYTLKLVFCHKQSFVYLQFYLYFEPGILSQTILCLFTILPIL